MSFSGGLCIGVHHVTTVTPMKRGLKVALFMGIPRSQAANMSSRYNRYPDEKGTES